MKRIYAGMAAALLAAILFIPLETEAVSADKAIVIDGTTQHVLFEKDADTQALIASTTKIMTALIVCEQCNVLDRVQIPKEAVGIEGSSMYLREGEVLTIQELLYGLMLQSGNDAATALAIYCGGTVEGFAELMNDKARSLGLLNTHFVNPSGLDAPGHYSTARDMACLTAYAMQNAIFRQTVSTKAVNVTGRRLTNHNKLLWRVEGANGVKTGYTKAAGRILVSSAERNGRQLIAVTISAPDDWNDHKKLINDGFSQFAEVSLISKGDQLGLATVSGGSQDSVSLIAAEDCSLYIAPWEEPKLVIKESGILYAPVVEGQSAGTAYICLDDVTVGRIPMIYGETVEATKEEKKSFWEKLFGSE
ncbi:MAG: D-alanyl-D-alanine carboxypeptidase [Oscillospiraceae bacterium]|nr:D-alanyl-D-alanine carboxypeptidase [Oscillospiraceae bacterium]